MSSSSLPSRVSATTRESGAAAARAHRGSGGAAAPAERGSGAGERGARGACRGGDPCRVAAVGFHDVDFGIAIAFRGEGETDGPSK